MIELPDGLMKKIADLSASGKFAQTWDELMTGEYAPVVQNNVLEAVQDRLFADWIDSQQISPADEAADVVAVVNAAIADAEAGRRTYSMEEIMARYGVTQDDLDNAPDGIINGQIK